MRLYHNFFFILKKDAFKSLGEKTANLFTTKKDDTAEAMHDAGEAISEKASDASEYVGDKSINIIITEK